jgi:hypothetical protein
MDPSLVDPSGKHLDDYWAHQASEICISLSQVLVQITSENTSKTEPFNDRNSSDIYAKTGKKSGA